MDTIGGYVFSDSEIRAMRKIIDSMKAVGTLAINSDTDEINIGFGHLPGALCVDPRLLMAMVVVFEAELRSRS